VALAAQQAPAGRGGGAAAEASAGRPPLLYKEEWKQPPYTGTLNDDNRRVTQEAIAHPRLELKIYGSDARQIGVYNHENRFDLWTGMATSPVAIMLRDTENFVDLTGLARLRAIVRTQALHTLHPIVKLADGTLIAGSRTIDTEGDFLSAEVAFSGMRWFKVDPVKVVTTVEVKDPNLGRVDEVGLVDLMPSGGHGNAGWANVSTFELYAKGLSRSGGGSAQR
jgi:hypothetical protein